MKESSSTEFLQIAARHANDAAYMKTLTWALSTGSRRRLHRMLAHAEAQEKATRQMIIAWKPRSKLEAQSKLLYVVKYLIVMRTSLDDQEMKAIMNSISHLHERYQI